MKVLHIVTSMDPKKGGVSQAIRNIIFENKYSEQEVVCLDNELSDYGTSDSFKTYKLDNGLTSFQYHSSLLKWLKSNIQKYTHVVVHGIWQYHNFATYRAMKQTPFSKRPILAIMPHGMLDPYFQKDPKRKLKAFRNELIWRLTERKSINSADVLLFTCKEELKLARTTFKGYLPKQEINVGLGIVEPPKFIDIFEHAFKEICPKVKGEDYFLYLSRIDTKKGVSILLDAYQVLETEGFSLPQLVIAGPLDNPYAKEMQEKAKGSTTIHFPGMLKGEAKWGAFYGASAFVLPSYQENFGIAIVEAMACSVPVLITKKVNIWQEIINGGGGWAIEKPAIETLKTELLAFNRLDQEKKDKFKAQAKTTFEKSFNVNQTALTFIETLKNLSK